MTRGLPRDFPIGPVRMAALAPDHVTPEQDKAIGLIKEWLRVAGLTWLAALAIRSGLI